MNCRSMLSAGAVLQPLCTLLAVAAAACMHCPTLLTSRTLPDTLLQINAGIVKSLVEACGKHCPKVRAAGTAWQAQSSRHSQRGSDSVQHGIAWTADAAEWPKNAVLVGSTLPAVLPHFPLNRRCSTSSPTPSTPPLAPALQFQLSCLTPLVLVHLTLQALLNIISNPVNSTVPIAAETLKRLGAWMWLLWVASQGRSLICGWAMQHCHSCKPLCRSVVFPLQACTTRSACWV